MPITLTLPSDAVALYVRASPSTSLAESVYVNMLSSSTLCAGIPLNTGASLIGRTSIVTVAILDVNSPSVTR